jgi:hypothetical protein
MKKDPSEAAVKVIAGFPNKEFSFSSRMTESTRLRANGRAAAGQA